MHNEMTNLNHIFRAYAQGASRMNTQTDKRRAFVEAIIERLRQHYIDRTPVPGRNEDCEEGLSLAQLQRLYRHVVAEGYGE